MARSTIYVGDQQPSLPTQVKDAVGNVVNLTGYTAVQFALRVAYGTVNKFKAAGVIVTPATGSIRYDLGVNDLVGLVPGIFAGQWILTDSGGKLQHVNAGEFIVEWAA